LVWMSGVYGICPRFSAQTNDAQPIGI